MKQASAHSIKGNRDRGAVQSFEPKAGTKIRALYDLLMANKGIPVRASITTIAFNTAVENLRDFYGLDIRKLPIDRKRGHGCGRGSGPATWVLAGEWFGKVYIDYIADRVGR